MDKQRLQKLAGIQLNEQFDFRGEEVTADNFEDIKRRMIDEFEAKLGRNTHKELKQEMLAAESPEHLVAIMMRAMGGSAGTGY